MRPIWKTLNIIFLLFWHWYICNTAGYYFSKESILFKFEIWKKKPKNQEVNIEFWGVQNSRSISNGTGVLLCLQRCNILHYTRNYVQEKCSNQTVYAYFPAVWIISSVNNKIVFLNMFNILIGLSKTQNETITKKVQKSA